MGDAAPRGQHATEGADHGLQVQVVRRELLRGRAADHPGPLPGCVSGDRDTADKRPLQESNTRHARGDQAEASERVGTGRMSESWQRVGTGRTPLALRNKETIVSGDLQCLNHRSCENVLLIPPPRVPPGPRSSPLSTTLSVDCLFLRSPSRVLYRTELIPRAPNDSWDQTVDQTVFVNKRNKWDQTQTPFSVWPTPARNETSKNTTGSLG